MKSSKKAALAKELEKLSKSDPKTWEKEIDKLLGTGLKRRNQKAEETFQEDVENPETD